MLGITSLLVKDLYGFVNLPRVMDLEHFMESFLALLSNQDPIFWPPVDRDENVLDFCKTLISMMMANELMSYVRNV